MSHPAPKSREQPLAFASFRLLRGQKILLENQLPVRIGSRALELLIALVERAGEVVGKNELMACVWPDTVVEENNLRVHVSAIRKLLGDGDHGARFIINVAGRGYSFVAPVTRVDETPADALARLNDSATLPVALTRVVGRDAVIHTVVSLLGIHRFVTLIGPGGIGKTTVGLAVADQLVGDHKPRVCFVDLAVVSDPQLVVVAIAVAVGSPAPLDDPVAALAAYLQPMQLLLLIDNCEHLVAAVAETVEKLLRVAPALQVLATSRERLQAEGEHAVPLAPLGCPDATTPVTAAEALKYPAVELFAERALAAHDAFAVTDQNIATIIAICRRLDGIPLALELVAARTGALGLDVLLRSLDQNLMAVSGGKRSGASRHQSLSATLAWSFRLLSQVEQVVLRRLSVFRDLFTAQAVAAVVTGEHVPPEAVAGTLMSLVQQSLLVADTSGASVRYRLLYVTRAFAVARLAESDEAAAVQRRHAEHLCHMLELAALDWDTLSRAAWLARIGVELADMRAALDWAFGASGDAGIGARLFLAALPIGVQLSVREFKPRALRTLELLCNQPAPDVAAELRVRMALVVLLVQSGANEADLRFEIERMMALAQAVGTSPLMTEPFSSHAVMALESGDCVAAVQRFEVFEAIAKRADDAYAVLVADRVGAQVFHWAGDQQRARVRAERVLRHPAAPIPLAYGQGPVDRQVSMRIVLARIAWLEGRADEAREIAAVAAELAATDAPIDVCQALGFAGCPIALWRGDRDEAQTLIDRLLDHARRYGFTRWYRLALCYCECLDASQPHAAAPVSTLQQDLLTTIDMRWANAETVARAVAGTAGWCNAELLRVAGERYQHARPDAAAVAELRYRTALEYARGHGALAWELRIATSLARLRAADGHRAEARETLESTCSRFREGLRTRDYQTALTLLASL